MNTINEFFFGVYPYVCLAVFLMGSLARFDRDQYTWKSDSSQMLRARQLRWGSNLFHIGILFLLFGHTVGLLTPHWVYEPFISPPAKQMFAIVSGGIAGLMCFIGLTMLLHRRLLDPRIRLTSHRTDLGDPDHPVGATRARADHAAFLVRTSCRCTRNADPVQLFAGRGHFSSALPTCWPRIDWPFKVHMVLGMTIFLLLPFSRLVHVWSGIATLAYLFRPYQIVRSRRLNVPAGQNLPRRVS